MGNPGMLQGVTWVLRGYSGLNWYFKRISVEFQKRLSKFYENSTVIFKELQVVAEKFQKAIQKRFLGHFRGFRIFSWGFNVSCGFQ